VNTAPLSVALSKRLLWETRGLACEEVGNRETAYHHMVMGKPDATEGVLAYLERREPRWQLRLSDEWPKKWPE
jgi:enoyl-CoA hydratase/carnithine racemase